MISQYFTRRILLFCSPHSNDKSDMRDRNDARDIHDCGCVSLHRGGNHAFRDFSSLRTHFRAAYCMRLLYVNMGHVNNISTLAKDCTNNMISTQLPIVEREG
jgi:hypothetical protein